MSRLIDAELRRKNGRRITKTLPIGGMKMKMAICAFCGEAFTYDRSKNRKYCSPECTVKAKELYKENQKEAKRMKRSYRPVSENEAKIIDIAVKAYKEGTTYGKYVAYMLNKEGKKCK